VEVNCGLQFYGINKMNELHLDINERSGFVTSDLFVGWGLV
jgi:hypothetical protein